MADQPPLPGICASSPPPASEPGPFLPPRGPQEAPALWPPASQYTLAILLVLFLSLLGWYGYGRSSFSARPARIERGAVPLTAVDLNEAELADLRLLPGVGEKLARAILDSRADDGPFHSPEDLRRVPGIGPATLERLRPYIRTEDAADAGALPRVARGAAPAARGKPLATRKPPPTEPVEVNTATEAQLQQLPGIGPTLAARILAARQARRFASVEDLRRVKGIGEKTLDKLRPHVRIGR